MDEEEIRDIGWAVGQMRLGDRVTRVGWNGPHQWLALQLLDMSAGSPKDDHSKMTLPYIYISTVTADRVPWLASQTDLLALDWRLST